MSDNFGSGQINNAIAQFYQFLQKSDDIIINCGETIFNAKIPDLFTVSTLASPTDNSYWGEGFLQNILYNVGF